MNPTTPRRAAPVLALLATVLLGLQSCGYFYNATVQGYVIDSNTNNGTTGVNNAIIWLYDKDPGPIAEDATEGPAGFFAKTATAAQGNYNGYYSAKVVWNNLAGKYAQEGDSSTFWIVITHENYKSAVFSVPGILSDSTNTVPDLRVKRATFTADSVRGQVLDANGDGLDGVRVVLNLYPADADPQVAAREDYVATTTTPNGGVAGSFQFDNVSWKDLGATGTTDTHQVRIKVSDNQYNGSPVLTPTLSSGTINTLPDPITATRKPRTEFSATLRGRIRTHFQGSGNESYNGVQGVGVSVSWQSDTGVTKTLATQSDAAGNFNFTLNWTDSAPLDFDQGGSNDGADDPALPEGEDGLLYDIAFTNLPTKDLGATLNLVQFNGMAVRLDSGTAGAQDTADTQASFTALELASNRNPNLFPDGVLEQQ